MVKRSDVDEIVNKAVSEEHDRLVSYYKDRMRSMAADYEARFAELKRGRGRKVCTKTPKSLLKNAEVNINKHKNHGSIIF